MKYTRNKYLQYIVICTALISCVNDDTDFNDLLSQSKREPIEITFPGEHLNEEPDQAPATDDPSYNDYIESLKSAVEISVTFNGDDVTINNPSSRVTITNNGAHVKANIDTTPVKFILSGNTANGSLNVSGDNRYAIIFAGADITNPAGAVINNQSKKTLYIVAQDGTDNVIRSKGTTEDDPSAKGCIFSEGQIAISGNGELQIYSDFRNGIASDDYIFVRAGSRIYIETNTGNGIKANDGVKINGGSINILVNYNGGKGINSEDYIEINGGRTTIINNGTTRLDKVPVSDEFKEGIDTVSCAGVKSDANILIQGGELRIKCTGDDTKGIKSNVDYIQNGGSVSIVTSGKKILSSPKGIKTDGSIVVTGGILYAYSRYSEAIDADGVIEAYSYITDTYYLVEIGR